MKAGWFLAGVIATLAVEGAFLGGVLHSTPEPQPVENNTHVVREMAFKVLAPKGFEDVAYVSMVCTPKVVESARKSGMKPAGPWQAKPRILVADRR